MQETFDVGRIGGRYSEAVDSELRGTEAYLSSEFDPYTFIQDKDNFHNKANQF